jgi:hypothetical protein
VPSAIAFDDARTASETLSGLRARPEILAGSITLPDGTVFAHYPAERHDAAAAAQSRRRDAAGHRFLLRRRDEDRVSDPPGSTR